MKKLAFVFALASMAFAQSVETLPFRVQLSSKNEVPALPDPASTATATVLAHVVRDASGQIVSGSVDFRVYYRLGAASNITAMHIHRGVATANGGIVIDSGLPGPINETQAGSIQTQGPVPPANQTALTALRDLVNNPAGFYLNLHTARNPGGEMRGQLEPADTLVLITQMSPSNEVPAIPGITATGAGSAIVYASWLPDGRLSSGEVVFDTNYTGFAEGTTFTGYHIHVGAAGANGPVVINTGLSSVAANPQGGNLHYEVQIDPANPAQASAVAGLFLNASGFYMNLHTQANPGGVIRGQLRNTDKMVFQCTLLPSNEVPAISGLDASAAASLTLHTIRNNDGWVQAGVSIFDSNFRFPGPVQFTGMHIHDGAAGVNGPVILNSRLAAANQPSSETGFGNIYRVVTQWTDADSSAMNLITLAPHNTYYNMHTTVNPGGVVRVQTAAHRHAPAITGVTSGVSDPARTTVAPLGLMTIFGSNLFSVPSGSAAFDSAAPLQLNGTTVTIGGKRAAIVTLGRENTFVPTDYIVAQVPADAVVGTQALSVESQTGTSSPAGVSVARISPDLYFDSLGAIAYRTDFSLIRPDSPAHTGENIVLLMTGLGQTLPALQTGQIAPSDSLAIVPALFSVTIGGKSATVTGAAAVSGFVGMYGLLVTVPDGVNGMVPVTVRTGDSTSNTAILPVH